MYCPNCGQSQISNEMRFCSRCGLALSGLAEWLATGRLTAPGTEEMPESLDSPRRKGMRRGAKLMFFSGVLFIVFMFFSILIHEGAIMFVPCALFFVSLVLILYARLFSSMTVERPMVQMPTVYDSALGSSFARGSLTAAANFPVPPIGKQQVRTNELSQPSSVTENTTRLLDE